LRWADYSFNGVLPSVLIRLRNLRCAETKVLRRTAEPVMPGRAVTQVVNRQLLTTKARVHA